MPVVRFGFQEPCNDPQNFCYLWVLHESKNKEQSALPFAVMYGILYKRRVSTVPNYGRHYKVKFFYCKFFAFILFYILVRVNCYYTILRKNFFSVHYK